MEENEHEDGLGNIGKYRGRTNTNCENNLYAEI